MNPVMSMLAKARNSTSPLIALFVWVCTWVFSVDQPAVIVMEYIDKTDPLKLFCGAVLVVGSLFLGGLKKEKPVDLVDVVKE